MNHPLRVPPLSSLVGCLVTCVGISALLISPALAQVDEFTDVINLPSDEILIPESLLEGLGVSIQLNVNNGGIVDDDLAAFGVRELNINGGTVGDNFLLGASFGEVNISGGTVGDNFVASFGSEVNISDGTVGDNFSVQAGSVNISGGNVGNGFVASGISSVNISGGDVGELSFSGQGSFSGGTAGLLDTIGNLLISGGSVDNVTSTSGGFVNVSDGNVGDVTLGDESTTTIFPASGFDGFLNFSGGTVENINAFFGSRVNIVGSEFLIDGSELDTSLLEQTEALSADFETVDGFIITDRDVTLSGLLASGEPFSFDLNSVNSIDNDFFAPSSLTVTLTSSVPEPSSSIFITLVVALGLARRRRG